MFKFNKILFFIILLALAVRLYGIDWDSGRHFHPDERMLIMVTDRIHLFDQMNPDFFNYGSLPVYMLRGASQLYDYLTSGNMTNYDGLLYVGRSLSVLADIIVLIFVYKIALFLFKNKAIAVWSAFFYALAFFPIQNAHFFVVDVYLNLFTTILLYLLLIYHDNPHWKKLVGISIIYAAALTTKVSAIIFLPVIGLVLLLSHTRRLRWWKELISRITAVIHQTHDTTRKRYFLTIFVRFVIFAVLTTLCAYLFMPYAFLQYERFLTDIMLQTKMNSDPYIFPYTLQYVGTEPYVYYLKNIFFWGVGPIMGILALFGLLDQVISFQKYLTKVHLTVNMGKKKLLNLIHSVVEKPFFIFYSFYFLYFLVIGMSAVKFMRYMLLMYPFIIILAALGYHTMSQWILVNFQSKLFVKIKQLVVVFLICIWSLAFISIYTYENTRIRATRWIQQFVPPGSTLAVEHWDDRVPIVDNGTYRFVELNLYDRPDDEKKWQMMNAKLKETDFIIIASNRLYVPLQKLKDCNKYTYCYPNTAEYYEKLFSRKLGFRKIIQFVSYPRLDFAGITIRINDDTADESFTVYDHPKIMIFKKTTK